MTGWGALDGCSLCDALQPGQDLQAAGTAAPVVAYVGSDVVVMLEGGGRGALVAPRPHLSSLSTDHDAAGAALAALRKAAIAVQEAYGTAGTMIEPTVDVPGAEGHVCFRVLPTLRNGATVPPASRAIDPERLAGAMRKSTGGCRAPDGAPLGWRVARFSDPAASPDD